MRADALERLAVEAGKRSRKGPLRPDPTLCRLAGCRTGDLDLILRALGYRKANDERGEVFLPRPPKGRKRPAGRPKGERSRPREAPSPDSPFAKLRALKIAP